MSACLSVCLFVSLFVFCLSVRLLFLCGSLVILYALPGSTRIPVPPSSTQAPTTQAPTTPQPIVVQCADDEFQCYDGVRCLQWSHRCDSIVDCHDNSDEVGCAGRQTLRMHFYSGVSKLI